MFWLAFEIKALNREFVENDENRIYKYNFGAIFLKSEFIVDTFVSRWSYLCKKYLELSFYFFNLMILNQLH